MVRKDYSTLKNGSDVRGVAIRGVKGDKVNLTKRAAQDIAAAFCTWLKEKTGKTSVRISVGHDPRISAKKLEKAIVKGIVSTGSNAETTGLSSTPSMFMLLKDENRSSDGSIMITASHLPYHRNGMKFFKADGGLESQDIAEILTLAEETTKKTVQKGTSEHKPYLDEYSKRLVRFVQEATGRQHPLKGKKIVVDAGNGAGGFYVDKVLRPLGADTEGSQFLDPDGRFPNHIPNPEDETAMRSARRMVLNAKADFGIIFDTDVDRAGAVDHTGEEINRNKLIALISAVLLEEKKGTIVTDSVTSDGLKEFINARGGKHHRFKRGYKNVINEAKRLNAAGEYTPLAIETSGHAALKENYFLDDGAYLITRLLVALAKESEKGNELTRLIDGLKEPKEETEVRFPFTDREHFKELGKRILSDFERYAEEQPFLSLAEDNLEGIRVNFQEGYGDGWLLARMSLHEPLLPVNAESNEEGGVEKMLDFFKAFLSGYDGIDLNDEK